MTRSDPVKQIRDLRRLLELYREGFPILKELVQNAEDAQATCLDYGWSEGLFKAEHPLLKSPALFFINNGKFDERDARSLYYFDVSGKSDQEGTIGKFGLGLKSVFHFCEAFFYLAPPLPEGSKPSCNIFNPWEGSGCHDDWDKFSQKDQEMIKEHLTLFLDQTEYQSGKWFIIWIPLRQEAHKTEKEKDENGTSLGTIKADEFFDTNKIPEFLQTDLYFEQVSSLLSNLHNLKIIRYWQDGKIKYQTQSINYSRLGLKELEQKLGQQKQFKGKFQVIKYDIQKQYIPTDNHYFGNEIILDKQELINILQHEKLKLENTEKIKAHCAVIFTRNGQNLEKKSFLSLHLATFLPVPVTEDENDEIKIDCSSEHSYNLTLHGYFFINYARTKIIGWEYSHLKVKEIEETDKEKSREQLETEWNFILYNYLLSQILETLSKFAVEYNLPPSEIEAICQCLKCSDLFKNNLSAIYRQYKYICRITLDGEKWELINIDERVLTLPDIPDWDVFTKLADLSSKVYFTLKRKPNLCLQNKPDQWEKSEILEIISNLNAQKFFSKSQYINDLKELIEKSGFKTHDDVQETLIKLVKKGLSSLDLENINKEIQKSMRSLISLIDKNKRVTIKCESYIIQEIYKLELSTLFIHQDVEPSEKSSGELNFDDANKIFHLLVQLLHEKSDEQQNIYKFIITFLKKLKSDIWNQVMEKNKELEFISGRQIKEEENQDVKQWYSYSYIKQNENTCFKETEENSLAQDLQKALAKDEIILIDTDIADLLSIHPCDSEKCLELLAQKPSLADKPENRVNLLKELLNKNDLASKKQLRLRYLLHGKQEHFDDIDTPLYITSQDSSLWQKIAQQVLKQKQQSWRLIDVSFALTLSTEEQQKLGISKYEQLIEEISAESLNHISLEKEEIIDLLNEFGNYNIELWKQLKFHEDVNGDLVSIGENTYLNIPGINIELPQQLQAKLTLIKLSNNTLQNALQRQHIPEWNQKTAICFLLDQEQPHHYFEYILKLFKQLSSEKNLDQQLKQKLKETQWLTDSTRKKALAPQDVIYIKSGKLKRHISRIVELEKGKYTTSDLNHQLKNEQQLTILFSHWDENYVIGKILSCPNPHEYCWIIMDALDSLLSNNNCNYADIKHENILAKTAWLITTKNTFIAPENIIYYDDLKKDIQDIFAQAESQNIETQYTDFSMLDKQIESKYPQIWKWLKDKHFIREIDKIIPKLKTIIEKLNDYQLGSFNHPNDLTREDIDKWIETKIFDHIDRNILPCWSVLKKITSTQRQNLLPSLQSLPLTSERIVAILNYLSAQFKGNDKDAIAVYNKYLQLACADVENFRDSILPNIKLLNQKNQWKTPQELCDPQKYHSIDPTYLLREDQGEVLSSYLKNITVISSQSVQDNNFVSPEPSSFSNVEKLQKYFTPWLPYVPSECVGVFLSLLAGNDNQIKTLAINYLEKRGFAGIENLRKRLIWSYKIREKTFTINILTSTTEQLKINNILGNSFYVSQSDKEVADLFAGELEKDTSQITLKAFSPDESNAYNLQNILKESCRIFIEKINGTQTNNESLDQIWQDIGESKQLEIFVAREVIINQSPFILRSLGIRNDELQQDLRDWDDVNFALSEAKRQKQTIEKIQKEIEDIIKEIKEKIEDDEIIQNEILTAVRRKIERQYGYKPISIPFELFQNADDALVELKTMLGDEKLEGERLQYIFQWDDHSLNIIHWGRPINDFINHISQTQFREKGFERDLIKMLSWNTSDKSEEATGQFGLGFKTVYLISKEPKIISGKLNFGVHAGLLPFPLAEDEKLAQLREQLDNESPSSSIKDGTIINLERDPVVTESIENIADEFATKAGILLIFSKFIKTCKIIGKSTELLTWNPINLLGIEGIELAEVKLLQIQGNNKEWINYNTICFRLEDHSVDEDGCVVISIPQNLSEQKSPLSELPTFWVTAPTKEKLGLRFIINSKFDVTTGRTSLDRNSQRNFEVAEYIGMKLGEKLENLFKRSQGQENWEYLQKQLKLDPTTDQYSFWNFLWHIFVLDWLNKINNDDETTQIIQKIFATKDCGMGYLITQCPSLPNGLWGKHRQLVCVNQVRYLVTELLAEQQYFEKVSTWVNFQKQYKPEQMIIQSVWENVKQLLGNFLQQKPNPITLIDVLKAEIPNNEVTPEQAEYLGNLITSDFLQQIINKPEYKDLNDFLQKLKFLSQANNKYNSANQLLVNSFTHQEEKDLAGFAEDDRVLHSDYQGTGLQFFDACRQDIDVLNFVSDKDKIDWAEKAKNKPEKKEALNKYVKKQKVEKEKQENLQREMEKASGLLLQIQPEALPEPKPIQLNPKEVLEKIYQWWQKEGDRYIQKYEEKTYPSGKFPQLSEADDFSDQTMREQWMILFVLGVTCTLGLTRDRQHRGFIETCQKQKWWQIFSISEPRQYADQWIGILDKYFDSKVNEMPYLYWFNKYPVIYLLDKYLSKYKEVFCAINLEQNQFRLIEYLHTKDSQIFSGGGYKLPPLSKVLGIGANFIVRELVRKNIIKNPLAYPHCFVPVKRVRKRFLKLGCPLEDKANIENSITIYKFLSEHIGQDKATFNHSFDLPFIAIADPDNKDKDDSQLKFLRNEINKFSDEE